VTLPILASVAAGLLSTAAVFAVFVVLLFLVSLP
jgi:hypothetical protein